MAYFAQCSYCWTQLHHKKYRRISQKHKNSCTITCLLFKFVHHGKFKNTKAVSIRPFIRKLFKFAGFFLSLSIDLLAADSLSCGQSVSRGIFYHNRVWTWRPASNKWIKPGGWTWKALLIRNNFISENKYSQGQRWRVGKTGSSVQFVKCQVSMRCDTVNSNLKSTALELTANLTLF